MQASVHARVHRRAANTCTHRRVMHTHIHREVCAHIKDLPCVHTDSQVRLYSQAPSFSRSHSLRDWQGGL